MNELKIFKNQYFGEVRTLLIDDEPYFVGKDVAEVLGYSNPRDALAKHVDDEDKNTVAICDGNKGNPNVTIINESGLYSLIFSSKLPAAKQFKRWVTSVVLPTIRRTGCYKGGRTARSMSVRKIYYPILDRELEARGIRNVDIARELGIHTDTLQGKLSGRIKFSLDQAITMQKKWFPDIPIEELFSHAKE